MSENRSLILHFYSNMDGNRFFTNWIENLFRPFEQARIILADTAHLLRRTGKNYTYRRSKTQDSRPKTLKGQASLIDVVLLSLLISVLLVVTAYSPNFYSVQTNREEAEYARSMMMSLMNYRNSTYGNFNNSGSMNMAEAVAGAYFCKNIISESDMNSTAKVLLDHFVKPNYNYILFASVNFTGGSQKVLWVWNSQSDVCTGSITLNTFNLELPCSYDSITGPMLGIWPKWKQLPPKSAC